MKTSDVQDGERIFSKEYALVTCISFLINANFMALMTTTSGFTLEVFGVTNSQAGLAASIFIIGAIGARLFAGWYTTEVRYKRMLLFGVAGMAAVSSVYFFAGSFTLFCVVRLANGFMFGIATNTSFAIISSIIPKSRAGEGMGYFALSQTTALALGPLFALRLLNEWGMAAVFFLAVAVTALGTVLVLLLELPAVREYGEGPGPDEGRLINRFIDMKILPIAALCFLIFCGHGSILSFVAVYGVQIGLQDYAAFIFAVIAVVTVAARPYVGKRFDRKGPNTIIYPGIVVFAIAILVLSQSTQGWMLLAVGALIGLGSGAVQSGTLSLVVKLASRDRFALANSTYYTLIDTAMAVGPVIAGALITAVGFRSMYLIMAIAVFFGIPLYYAVYARRHRQETVN